MKTKEIRQLFLDFFKQHKHTVVPSSSLVPDNDPTLLFTNAGMVQFKDVFLGKVDLGFRRAVSSQKCVRAGGKHNDLENVGFTARHHTFFEMLGNFSFGDYFKREAINFAWDFVTKSLKIPAEKLWVTVHKDDKESENIWLNEVKIDLSRFSRCGDKDNFWSMGETGPCGPCTEIFYDHGKEIAGGPPGSPDEDGDRYVEIWNLVFMQYNRDESGNLDLLPKPSVDTGMGLERIAAVMQGVHSNYEIDLFHNLIIEAARVINTKDLSNKSLRVIVDHLRSCAFLVADGVFPANEGRGYVLRRIMRRAIRHGRSLGAKKPFFYKLVGSLVKEMGDTYTDLRDKQEYIEKVFLTEEKQFGKTLEQGLKIFFSAMDEIKGNKISGDIAFKLYDTYGFPVDLTADLAREKGMEVDMHGFEQAMLTQRHRARMASQFKGSSEKIVTTMTKTVFTGYNSLESKAKITEIFKEDKNTQELKAGDKGIIILDRTPFYAESGGQVGDKGELVTEHGVFVVQDTKKIANAHAHYGEVISGSFKTQDLVLAKVDKYLREATVRNHSATHLLHAALRNILGSHVIQKGSVVEPSRLRFDFSHSEPLTTSQIREIETLVNEKIMENTEAKIEVMSVEEAKEKGAMALFDEKYAEEVRVLSMSDGFSVELCGGTHAKRTGDIGFFKIVSETGIASGVRRIEALTGDGAIEYINKNEDIINNLATKLKTTKDGIEDKIETLNNKIKSLEKEVKKLQIALTSGGAKSSMDEEVKEISGIKILTKHLLHVDPKSLREAIDRYKNQLKKAVIVLATENNGKVNIAVGVTKEESKLLNAVELVNYVADFVDGKGGGRPDMAMAGGNDPAKLQQALDSVADWVQAKT